MTNVCNLFLVKNYKFLQSYQKIHSKKLFALTKGNDNVRHDSNTCNLNISKYKPNKVKRFRLSKGFQFAVLNLLKLNINILCYYLKSYKEALTLKRFLVKILVLLKINC